MSRLRWVERAEGPRETLPAPWVDRNGGRVDVLRKLLNGRQDASGWRRRGDRPRRRVTGRVLFVLVVWGILCGRAGAATWYPTADQDGVASWADTELGLWAWGGVWRLTPFGLGIDGGAGDYHPLEIGQTPTGEWAAVQFATPQTAVTVDLRQFYPLEDDCLAWRWPDCVPTRTWQETGTFWIDDGPPVSFHATRSDGRYSLVVARDTPFTRLGLTGDGLWSATDGAEFTLAAITYTAAAIPEPEVWIMLGVGLFALVSSYLRRRRE